MKLLAIIVSALGGVFFSSFATAANNFISIGTGGQTGAFITLLDNLFVDL